MWQCLESGWLKQQAEASRLKVIEEETAGKKLIVGVNAFQGEEGPINKAVGGTAYKVPSKQARLRVIRAVKELRRRRNQQRISDTLKELYQVTREDKNVVRPTIEAIKAGKFHLYPLKTVSEGIEILTGVPGGRRLANGRFTPGSVFHKANARLREMALSLDRFGRDEKQKHADNSVPKRKRARSKGTC